MTDEKVIEQLKIARCAFSTPEMREAFQRAIEAFQTEPTETKAEYKDAARKLHYLIEQKNDDDYNPDIYTDDDGNRFYFLDDSDFKAFRTAIHVLLEAAKQEPPIVSQYKWDCVKDAMKKLGGVQ